MRFIAMSLKFLIALLSVFRDFARDIERREVAATITKKTRPRAPWA